jgi:hypothetical protein
MQSPNGGSEDRGRPLIYVLFNFSFAFNDGKWSATGEKPLIHQDFTAFIIGRSPFSDWFF